MKNLLSQNFTCPQDYGMNFLSDVERVHLRTQHKKERDKRICDRIKAVLLYDKG